MPAKRSHLFLNGRVTVTNLKTGKSHTTKKALKGFIDSGSTHTVIPLKVIGLLEGLVGPFQRVSKLISTAGGRREVMALQNVEVCMRNCCVRGEVLAVDGGIPGDILIGHDFLTQTKACVDFGANRFSCATRFP